MAKARLIVASARLPVTLQRRPDGWDISRSTGGLVTALNAVSEKRPFTWIGWPGTVVAESERAVVRERLAEHGAVPVFASKTDTDGFYLGFSNRVLWPLFHNLTDKVHFDPASYRAYERVNAAFADAILAQAGPKDLIWIHDYQLALVPELLRRRGLRSRIGYFLHIPFPSDETYRQLPPRRDVLNGILGSDFVAFHAYEYVSHFRAACLRVLGYDTDVESIRTPTRTVHLAALPIGIDPEEVRSMAQAQEARDELRSLRQTYEGKKLIVGVDRLDYTKGIPEKLRAFEELLRRQSKWRQRAVLIQVAAPSRTGVDEYQQLKREVDELVGRINGRYGTPSSTPVAYVNQSVPRERLVGLYQAADVALITPLRDGMNLVALEYVAARGDRGGQLILSEFAGAAHCLPGARLVSPHHLDEVSSQLHAALEAGSAQLTYMQRFVDRNTSEAWAHRFLDHLEGVPEAHRASLQPLSLTDAGLRNKLSKAKRPIVVLDYDGTLRSFVVDPREASPTPELMTMLKTLGEAATVVIISGRDRSSLEQWLGDLPITLVCEHGLMLREPGKSWERRVQAGGATLTRLVEPIFNDFVHRTPGSSVEHKEASIAWHYRAADPEFASFQVHDLLGVLEDVLKRRPYSVLRGNRVVEVRHRKVTKGQALAAVLKRHSKADLLFCAGDDRTDEEMMAAIPNNWAQRAVTCWVGGRNRHAAYWVDESQSLIRVLQQVADGWLDAKNAVPRGSSRQKRAR